MYQLTRQYRTGVDAVHMPSTGVVVLTALAASFVPLTTLVFVTYPTGGLTAAVAAVVAIAARRAARTRRARQPSRGVGKHPAVGETTDPTVDEGAP